MAVGHDSKNTVAMNNKAMQIVTTPTALQQHAFVLFEVSLP
jgi:hypothetical protein